MVSPGSENRADAKEDHPGTWEVLYSPRPEKPAGDNGTITPGLQLQRWDATGGVATHGTKPTAREAVSPSEGDETKREGMQEVLALQ